MTYLFTICEYGGREMASCRLTCREEFADGFELGLEMRIDEDTHYIVTAAGCYRVFTETASGARADRPVLEQLLDQLRPGDTLVV